MDNIELDYINRLVSLSGRNLLSIDAQSIEILINKVLEPYGYHTSRAYLYAINLFLEFLEAQYGSSLPLEIQEQWRPFTSKKTVQDQQVQNTIWHYNVPTAILCLIQNDTLDLFVAKCYSSAIKTVRVNTYKSAIRHLLSFAFDLGIINRKYMFRKEATSKSTYSLRVTLSNHEILNLLNYTDQPTLKGKRDSAILHCLLYAGLSAGDISKLTFNQFQHTNRHMVVNLSQSKERRGRLLMVHPKLLDSLVAWFYAAAFNWNMTDKPVFVPITRANSIVDAPISTISVNKIVADNVIGSNIVQSAKRSDFITKLMYMTCADNALRNGAALSHVVSMLGIRLDSIVEYLGLSNLDVVAELAGISNSYVLKYSRENQANSKSAVSFIDYSV